MLPPYGIGLKNNEKVYVSMRFIQLFSLILIVSIKLGVNSKLILVGGYSGIDENYSKNSYILP